MQMISKVNFDLTNLKEITNDIYYPLYANKDRYLVMYGGAGSGKSHFAAQKLLIRIIKAIKHGYKEKFLALRKTGPAVRKSVYSLIKNYIQKWNLSKLVDINKTAMTFTFEGGSEILCSGLDDPEKIKSIEGITSIWLEETTELTPDDFTQCDLRLRGETPSYKQIVMSFNPISHLSWLNERFFQDKTPEKTKIVHSTYRDNRFLDKEYVDILEDLKNQDKTYYDVYSLGLWGVLSNLVYNNWQVDSTVTKDRLFYDDIYTGLDFGFNNPSALLQIGIRDETIYIFNELYEKGLTNTELIKKCKGIVRDEDIIIADSAEPARIEEFCNAGYMVEPCTKGDKSVKHGIDWIKRHKTLIHPDCVNTIAEFKTYKYKQDKEGNIYDDPVKFKDHAMDALRYGLEPLMIEERQAAPGFAVLGI